ncbi:P-loop containing nucleoside triphosphate hydrolase protein [Lophiostoma macrostomum CBS 122681]|uniref:P-loop containing nucleoside triphosphate hydrolase protein n=1 Tax=Lophiostoma macrostomum CBS 122681 TaxID=1314788 RepID=A0A6A6TJX0_9PLEO|nr:P-loop containing nucleoside triphosphate hydrolase protein [Lophiostoma macrostomum CBS 122681]
MRNALQRICGDNEFINTRATPIVINAPFQALFMYREGIRKCAAESKEENEKTQMDLLVGFIKKHLKHTESELNRLLPSKRITWGVAWTLFRPGTVAVTQRDYYEECYVVSTLSIVRTRNGKELQILVRGWDYNGARFGPVNKMVSIPQFPGVRQVAALEIYPISFHQDKDGVDLRKKLIDRGHKWKTMLNKTHVVYNGNQSPVTIIRIGMLTVMQDLTWTVPPGLAMSPEPITIDKLVPAHVSSRVMLDYTSHQQANPSQSTILSESSAKAMNTPAETESRIDPESFYDSADENLSYPDDSSYIMTDEQALLCPARVRGFSLSDKTWGFFLVDSVKDIKWEKNTMARLEVDAGVKDAVRSLVHTYSKGEKRINKPLEDIVAGKGTGLVFLLSGPPGLGKTLTAECIAEEMKLPLYAITSGELGTNVVNIDQQLRSLFARARSWRAILLLDEADVFLAKRKTADLERNALVSVFLRSIEYYPGIIFLTSNRSVDFDKAFESRIHLKIQYQPLNAQQRTSIWRQLHQSFADRLWDSTVYEDLGRKLELNGREIKNVFQVALAIAEYRGQKLTNEHIWEVHGLDSMWHDSKQDYID